MQISGPLFLDRDGVINRRLPGDYVKNPAEFVFADGALAALRVLAAHFYPIVVVTNQAGIGKGLMTEAELALVHETMLVAVQAAGGRIDRAYYCPHLSGAGCGCRKPAPGMGWQAKADFPEIDFSRAWMVGDSLSDIAFGRALGMQTILIEGKAEETEAAMDIEVTGRYSSLWAWATAEGRFLDGISKTHAV